MKTINFGASKLAAVLAAAALTLSGCAAGMGSESSSPNQSQVGPDVSASFSSMDIMFAQMMIPHHQQALDMGFIALAKSQNEDVLQLATEISSEQEPEIAIMRSWLSASGAEDDMGHGGHGMADMGHGGHGMDGMLTEEQMAALLNSSGSEFDELFLQGMIAHHEGAIDMTRMIINSSNPEVKALAEAIVSSQLEQIAYMRTLLAK